MNRVFVLPPANCTSLRARQLMSKNSASALSMWLRGAGAPLEEVFTYLSALYFRGKVAYARAFAEPPSGCPGIFVITPTKGLVAHDTLIQLPRLTGFSRIPINARNDTYRAALQRSARKLAGELRANCDLVLLGSVATGKYLDILTPIFGSRLRIPAEFVGLGDMSRGGLLLRCVREHRQLNYIDAAAFSTSGSQPNLCNQPIIAKLPRTCHDDYIFGDPKSG